MITNNEKVWNLLAKNTDGKIKPESTLDDLRDFTGLHTRLKEELELRLSESLSEAFTVEEFKEEMQSQFQDFEGEYTQTAYTLVKGGRRRMPLSEFFESYMGYQFEFELVHLAAEGVDLAYFEKELEQQAKTIELKSNLPELDEVEFGTINQRIAWLYKLGIDQFILDKCKDGDTNIYGRAANILHTITGIDSSTLRKALTAIHTDGTIKSNNNPLKKKSNVYFADGLMEKFKLKSEK